MDKKFKYKREVFGHELNTIFGTKKISKNFIQKTCDKIYILLATSLKRSYLYKGNYPCLFFKVVCAFLRTPNFREKPSNLQY